MALISNPTDWRCSSAGNALGAAFSGIWVQIPVGEIFFYFISFFCVL